MIADEIEFRLYDPQTYAALKKELDAVGERARKVLQEATDRRAQVASYGASATTTVLNAMFEIDKFISFIVDDNPVRQGRVSPGFKIPVVSNAEFLAANPAVTFIAAWRYADVIVSRNQAYLDGGGQFVVPLPAFRVVSKVGADQK